MSSHNGVFEIKRRSADFHPSIWGEYFLSYHAEDDNVKKSEDGTKQQVQILKEEVKRMLLAGVPKAFETLELTDIIQRLGVFYHFEAEIDEALQQMYNNYHDSDYIDLNDCGLYTTALWFRLLRQQGYNISCDVFNKFKDIQGNFKESIISDVRGMLSLYDATHMRVHGEDILDEALVFTTTHLETMASHLSPPLAEQVRHALNQPIRKGISRMEAWHFISVYEQEATHNKILLTFAKLDFNLLQKIHQKELGEISRWWKDLDFSTKLPFARDRLVEGYFWALGVFFEPHYYLARLILTKVIAMTSIIDDIYDVYGTFEELLLFTDAIERWNFNAMDQLPEYMKMCYHALLNVYKEMGEKMSDGRLYRLDYAKEAMKIQVRAYLREAKWFHQQYTPTMDEYMSVALVSTANKMLAVASFVGMGDVVTKHAFDWLFSNPKMVTAVEIIGRLMNDIVSHKFERKRGHVDSAVECYMKEHDVAEDETMKEFLTRVENAWKDVNTECMSPHAVPMSLLTRLLNLSRVQDVVYKDGDGYTHPQIFLKDFVTSLLVVPV